jgi:hypothetical protein
MVAAAQVPFKDVGRALIDVVADIIVARANHHRIPRNRHRNAEFVDDGAVAGRQPLGRSPVVGPAGVALKDIGRALFLYAVHG